MRGYGLKDVARLLELSESQLRSLLAAGWVTPLRGARGALRLSFQDLVVLRTAKELKARGLSGRRLRSALTALRTQLPQGADLSRLRITAQGDELVVRGADGAYRGPYAPGSGQLLFDFEVGELSQKVAPLADRALAEAAEDPALDAEGWYALGADLDAGSPPQAQAAYLAALALDPDHLEARIDLGRLLHEAGEPAAAAAQYAAALERAPGHPVALFNLGVAREDLGELAGAVEAYQAALASDPSEADAHHNLGRLLDRLGDPEAALRHLAAYRRLTRVS